MAFLAEDIGGGDGPVITHGHQDKQGFFYGTDPVHTLGHKGGGQLWWVS